MYYVNYGTMSPAIVPCIERSHGDSQYHFGEKLF